MLSSSRQTSLTKSRDRLARSIEKFERLAHDAIEHLELLREERNEFEKKFRDLQRQVDDDRANSKHNEKLYESLQEDLKSQQTEIDSLNAKRDEQQLILREQLQTIERLETELSGVSQKLNETDSSSSQRQSEVEELRTYIATLEERVARAGLERDELREQLYTRERDDSQWAVKLTADEQRKAEKELDKLVNRIDDIERQMTVSENGETRKAASKKQVEETA
jgi:peptidoglycan hydrolase CwlO-like protein